MGNSSPSPLSSPPTSIGVYLFRGKSKTGKISYKVLTDRSPSIYDGYSWYLIDSVSAPSYAQGHKILSNRHKELDIEPLATIDSSNLVIKRNVTILSSSSS